MEKIRVKVHNFVVRNILDNYKKQINIENQTTTLQHTSLKEQRRVTGIEARITEKQHNNGTKNDWKEISITLSTLLFVSCIINMVLLFKWVGLKDYILFNCL